MSSIKIILPGPVSIRIKDFGFAIAGLEGHVLFSFRDAAHRDAIEAVLERAHRQGYAVEVKLLHYEGYPDKHGQDAARKANKRRRLEESDE